MEMINTNFWSRWMQVIKPTCFIQVGKAVVSLVRPLGGVQYKTVFVSPPGAQKFGLAWFSNYWTFTVTLILKLIITMIISLFFFWRSFSLLAVASYKTYLCHTHWAGGCFFFRPLGGVQYETVLFLFSLGLKILD